MLWPVPLPLTLHMNGKQLPVLYVPTVVSAFATPASTKLKARTAITTQVRFIVIPLFEFPFDLLTTGRQSFPAWHKQECTSHANAAGGL
jgi:hypothetical protein